MVSTVASSLVCILCATRLPAVWADDCSSYWDGGGLYHDTRPCGTWYCCGDCNKKYCCFGQNKRLTQEKQEGCVVRSGKVKNVLVPYIVGGIFACVFPIVLCVGLIICFVCPCCVVYKKCRRRRNQQVAINTTTVINAPQQPLSPQPSHPGYQPVPVLHGYGGQPTPTAPPHSYPEASEYCNRLIHFKEPVLVLLTTH
uniref:Shisa N-terminal domain-containing protein n=1 Tax=Scophthalmus maximus TaxID=52904 RepID=A0A8D3DHD7_SCOMX